MGHSAFLGVVQENFSVRIPLGVVLGALLPDRSRFVHHFCLASGIKVVDYPIRIKTPSRRRIGNRTIRVPICVCVLRRHSISASTSRRPVNGIKENILH
jgi:hypothetical protein